MSVQYTSLRSISGPLVVLEGVSGVSYDELVEVRLDDGSRRTGRVAELDGDKAVVLVFEGTAGISLGNARVRFVGRPLELPLSKEMLGRVFDGVGRPADRLPPMFSQTRANINGLPLNPISRVYPKNYIETGISAIDGLTTLIRGQKLPVFSGSGLPHDRLASQIVRQARISGEENSRFAVVFAAMGVKNDVSDFFERSFIESGVMNRVVMFKNLSGDPIIERITTPRCALTAAEYLAYECGMHILVVMTDMTAYAEALRELSSSKNEIPGRKGFPCYLYSDFASLYERAGIVEGASGSVTQIPILTMPSDDITHPVPDLTGYITEGQIVLDRGLAQSGVYPPIAVLPSLSRLMKDGIGEGFTREDHPALSSQLFASRSRVEEARALASVIGEEELSETDKRYIEFGRRFESEFLTQGPGENRRLEDTLSIGWRVLSSLPDAELDRIDGQLIAKYRKGAVRNV